MWGRDFLAKRGTGNSMIVMGERAYMLIRKKASVDEGWGMRRREENVEI